MSLTDKGKTGVCAGKRVIGITGGVGSGKSRILSVLKSEYGAEVIQADQVAAELEEPGQEGLVLLVERFGTDILALDGTLDRKAFADRIFADPAALAEVNRIIHPLTIREMKQRIKASGSELVAVEAALFDEESRKLCDEMWLIDTDEETRIGRLMRDRRYSYEKCKSIMKNQPSREQFLALSDQVIDNNGSIEDIRRQLRERLGRDHI
ncbi:MAG: dephospho-CoA kinase [Clostridiales bacterium]|nr:dephospho-CoA kinase [Clostridiales bacterium]